MWGDMVFNRKIIFFAIFFVSLLAISTVNAADNITDDIIGYEQNPDVFTVDNVDDELSVTNEDTLSASPGKYQDLANLIDKTKENGILKLKKDYKYENSFSNNGISIDKAITIDGNGHYIDGNNLARAFVVSSRNVTIKNLVFKNCYNGNSYDSNGGSIYWSGYNGYLTNCKFINSRTVSSYKSNVNYAYSEGGAVYWSGNNGKITNCDFNDCYCSYDKEKSSDGYSRGGAVYWSGSAGVISNSQFRNCFADSSYCSYGGSVYFSSTDAIISNSLFYNSFTKSNTYSYGGAIYWSYSGGILRNSQFNHCFATASYYTPCGAAVYWGGSSGLIDGCRFVENSQDENGVVYISGNYMDVESSYFCDNAKNDLYWTGSGGKVHNSVLYSKTNYYPVYSKSYSVDANYNWWGNTNLDYNKKLYSPSNVAFSNWLYLTASTSKSSLFVGESANIYINLNNLYAGSSSKYTNSKLPAVTFTVTEENFINYCTIYNGYGVYRYVAKSVPMDPVIVQFDTHVNIFKYNVKKVSTKIIAPQVKTVYNSGKYLRITLKDKYNNRVSGTIVGVKFAGKTHLLTTKYLGQVKVSLKGLKPKKYSAKIQFVGDKNYYASSSSTKVIIKKANPKVKVTKTFKSKSKKKIVKITLKDGIGPIKKTKVKFKLKGKTYKGKTNKKGVVKFDVSKKLKKIGKYKAVIKVKKSKFYNKVNKKVKISVKKYKKSKKSKKSKK